MPVITLEQFREGLVSNEGVWILSIRAKTVPDLYLKGNPYKGRYHKITIANGTIGADYQKSTNTALEKWGLDPNFVAGPHAWATFVHKHLVRNEAGTREYLRFIVKNRREFWYVDGRPVDASVLEPWFKPKQEEIKTYRNYATDNILSMRWRKRTYMITRRQPVYVDM
jgi:hypothetical protein